MGYTITRIGDTDQYNIMNFTADDEADLQEINTADVPAGSSVLVLSSSDVYILNTKKEWVKL